MKLRWWLLAAYLVLLLGSHAVRWRSSPAPPNGPSLTLAAVGGEAPPVRLAYRQWPAGAGPAGAPAAAPLLLLHGSPGSSADFAALAPLLEHRFRLIAPDLPGFGSSSRSVPDYSIRAHAEYAERLLRRLEIGRAHLVGFSMGGGVALELARRAPDAVASLTLLSSIGIQEFELLGSYHINHAIHAAQLAALVGLHEGVPHFGLLDGAMLDRAYARNFFDSDQRPLRGVLESLEAPTLVLHGERDLLVPVAAAREHHRIVPQSELVVLESDHFALFREPRSIAEPLAAFIDRVESGRALDRASAAAERLAAAALPFDPAGLPRASGLTAFVWFVLLALATLVSEDLTCISAGLLAAQGRIGLFTATAACGFGIFVGDLALFAVGRFLGRPWLRRRPLRWFLDEARIEAASAWFRRRGAAVILLSRFTPGMRLTTYFAAGLLRTSPTRFALYFALAVAVWTPILVGASAAIGAPLLDWIAGRPLAATLALPALALALWLLLALVRSLASWRGRRLWIGRLRRWRHWEFWPVWFFYLPVFVYIVGLGLRHRSPTLFTAANPGLPAGGFVGESKRAILERLPAGAVARFALLPGTLPAAARRALVDRFAAEHDLGPPLVLKPDVGERGRGVTIARSWGDIDRYLEGTTADTLVQEFVGGRELGVFYVRLPSEDAGRILSITDKRLISVTGDGRSTLEELILADRRAVCMAPLFLRRHRHRLAEVPADGDEVRLVDVGTHCRGALFLDGKRFATPALTAAIDEIGQGVEGFHFGRFDLRAPSPAALLEGRDIKVLELNGVTSEATHIYDPAFTLPSAYRVLFEQWRLAFEIGAENRRRGVRPASIGTLTGMVRDWIAGWHRPPDG